MGCGWRREKGEGNELGEWGDGLRGERNLTAKTRGRKEVYRRERESAENFAEGENEREI